MRPALGDIVLFTFDKARREQIETHGAGPLAEFGQGTSVPAVVVAVWGDDCVNLRVHPDGPGPDLWETSVTRKKENNEDCSHWAYRTTL